MSVLPVPDEAVPGRRAARAVPLPTVTACLVVAVLLFAVAWPGLLASKAPDAVDPLHVLAAPSGAHWLGTDQVGRDVLARIIYGTRPSLFIGVAATVLAAVAGAAGGLLSALGGPLIDGVVMRVVDVLLAFPSLLLALLIVTLAGPSSVNATLAIAFAAAPGYARLLRGQTLAVVRAGYVQAATELGYRWPRVVARHVLPNSVSPLMALATLGLGETILAGASLSFLGLGPRPPSPQWGTMLSDGRDYLDQAWWIAVFPGLAILLAVVALTVLGRRLHARIGDGAQR